MKSIFIVLLSIIAFSSNAQPPHSQIGRPPMQNARFIPGRSVAELPAPTKIIRTRTKVILVFDRKKFPPIQNRLRGRHWRQERRFHRHH